MTIEAAPMGHEDDVDKISVSALKTNPTKWFRRVEEGYQVFVFSGNECLGGLATPEALDALAVQEDQYWSQRVAEAEHSGTVAWDTALGELEGGQA